MNKDEKQFSVSRAASKKILFALLPLLSCVLSDTTLVLVSGAEHAPSAADPVSLAKFADLETKGWRTVPRGTQSCDGVKFVCEGAIRPAGLHGAGNGKRYPGAVIDVPIRRRGTRIHLLQAAENTSDAIEGEPYGRIILHYTNGEIRRFDLLFGVHGRDWYQSRRRGDEPVFDLNSKIGWTEKRARDGVTIRFYHTALANPLPGVEITTADFVSPLHSANMLLFGFAVDNDPHPLAPVWQPGEALAAIPRTDQIIVNLQDPTGRPLSDATLSWTALALGIVVDFPPLRPDAAGRVPLEFQRGALGQIRYVATAADGATNSGELQPDDTGNFAPAIAIKVRPGQ